MLADPEAIKQVFTGDPKVFHAGEGNEILAPLLGRNSLLVLDEKRHMSQRKLLLPPFHGERMQGYERIMGEIAEREIESWPTGTPYQLRPADAGADPGDHPAHRLRRRRGRGGKLAELRDALRDFLDITTNPRFLLPLLLVGPERIRGVSALPPPHRSRRRADLPRDRRAPPRRRPRGARRRPLDAGRRPPRGRQPDERRRDARRAAHPARRRPRDDGDLALLGGRAARPPPGQARAPARRGRRGPRGVPDRDDPGDAAPAPGDLDRPAQAHRAGRDRRLRAARRRLGRALASTSSTATPRSTPSPSASAPSASSRPRPAPTPGSPSAAASAAASAPPSPSSRWPSSSSELVKRHQIRPADPKPERIFRRAITETPRHNAEVILG